MLACKDGFAKAYLLLLQLAYLPYRRRDIVLDNESNELLLPVEGSGLSLEDSFKEEKKNRKGLLNWFKLRVSNFALVIFSYSFTFTHVEYKIKCM
jgi:hypothetical protein